MCVTDLCIALGGHLYPCFSDEETQALQLVSKEPEVEPRSVSSKAGVLFPPFIGFYWRQSKWPKDSSWVPGRKLGSLHLALRWGYSESLGLVCGRPWALGGMTGRVAEYECLAVRVIAMGREEMGWGMGAWWLYRLKAGQNRAGGFEWVRISHHLLCPYFLLFQMFSSQQTLLSAYYVQGMFCMFGGRDVGEQRWMNHSTIAALRGSWHNRGADIEMAKCTKQQSDLPNKNWVRRPPDSLGASRKASWMKCSQWTLKIKSHFVELRNEEGVIGRCADGGKGPAIPFVLVRLPGQRHGLLKGESSCQGFWSSHQELRVGLSTQVGHCLPRLWFHLRFRRYWGLGSFSCNTRPTCLLCTYPLTTRSALGLRDGGMGLEECCHLVVWLWTRLVFPWAPSSESKGIIHFSISPFNEYSGLISVRIDWSPCSPITATYNAYILCARCSSKYFAYKVGSLQPRKGSSPELDCAGTLTLKFSFQNYEKQMCGL